MQVDGSSNGMHCAANNGQRSRDTGTCRIARDSADDISPSGAAHSFLKELSAHNRVGENVYCDREGYIILKKRERIVLLLF